MTIERKTKRAGGETKPPITLPANDYARLSRLALAAADRMPSVASVLTEELERAHVLADGPSGHSICMGSEVEFRDDTTGKVQTATLVYPGDADISLGRISSTHSRGDRTDRPRRRRLHHWETRTGELRQLTVLKVRELQPA